MKSRISDKARIARGLGKGDDEHKPWIRPRDFSSTGRVHRMKLSKAKHSQVALSDLERNYILLSEFALNVISVKAQVALLPLKVTQKIAWDHNINHPSDGKMDRVMSTDLLLDIKEGKTIKQRAVCIKPGTLLDKRVIEKFQIEKIYWERKGVDWAIATDKELDSIAVNNVLFLRDYRLSKNPYAPMILQFFKSEHSKFINESIGELISKAAQTNRITLNDARVSFLHMLSKRIIDFDIHSSFNWNRKAYDFNHIKK